MAQTRVGRRKKKVTPGQADPGSSRKRRADKNKSRSDDLVAHRNGKKESGAHAAVVSDAVPRQIPRTEQSPMVEPKPTIQQSVLITRLPASRRTSRIRSVRHRIANPVLDTNPNAPKPASALAGPASTKIVVVSAEQLQQEREQAACPQVRPPRTPSYPLSGRLAFEALFKN